jgi:hypothetical protein
MNVTSQYQVYVSAYYITPQQIITYCVWHFSIVTVISYKALLLHVMTVCNFALTTGQSKCISVPNTQSVENNEY